MRLDILNLSLMLCAAGAVLAGGTILARRDVQERVPVDRTLIREFSLEFSGELRRLESFYLDDLQRLAGKASTANEADLKELCSALRGVRQYSLLYKKSGRQSKHIKIGPLTSELVPEPVVRSAQDPSPFPHQIALAREQVFPKSSSKAEKDEGWVMPRDGKFALFWKRSGEDAVHAFLLDMREIGTISSDYLKPKITVLYAPVRAEGGLHRLEGPGGAFLAGLEQPPQRAPDFIVPFSSRIGNWQILSWDTFRPHIVYHQPTLFVTGILSIILVAAGLILFSQQRRAQRLAEQRVSFVNRVSHELGTPLTNMLLNLELSVEALDAQRPQDFRRRLDFVVEETRRLARLVRNVLVFSRRERGKLKINPAPCVPDEVISSVLNQFGPALARAGIAVEHRGAAAETILCDIDALAQIVANLVSNVEKYAASGKWLGIESSLVEDAPPFAKKPCGPACNAMRSIAGRLPQGGSSVAEVAMDKMAFLASEVSAKIPSAWARGASLVVRISDRGPGVPAEAQERIFHPFERVANSVHEGITGTGLGLAIARDLAELMGGTLKFVAVDKGAVFELRLPACHA